MNPGPNQEPATVPATKPVAANPTMGCEGKYVDHQELRDLERSSGVFSSIDADPLLSYKLPKPGATAGQVLEFACKSFEKILAANKPMTFKFGITHDAVFRWYNRKFGYEFSKEPFDNMHILYAAANPYGPAFLEASLISRFGSF